MSKETLGMIIGLCVLGILYFGGGRLRDEAFRANLPKFKWGDAQRRDVQPRWWSSDLFLGGMVVIVGAAMIGLARRGYLQIVIQ